MSVSPVGEERRERERERETGEASKTREEPGRLYYKSIILVTKTQLEGTSPQVDNRGVSGKFGGSSGKLNVFLFFAREASGGWGGSRSRSERCVRG